MIPLNMLNPKNKFGKILAIGELLVDFVPSKIDMKLSDSGTIIKTASGSSGIFACAQANFSNNSGFIGKIGTDSLSRLVYDIVKRQGVDLSRVIISDEGQIGLAFIEYTKTGRNYQYYRKDSVGSKLSASDIDLDYIKSAFAVHYSGMLLELSAEMKSACLKAVETAKANGVLISFDPNIRHELVHNNDAKLRLKNAVSTADIISPTLEEARFITDKYEINDVLDALHQMGPCVVALTRDKDGAILSCNNNIVHAKGIDIDAIDPTGAGDTFAAALIFCMQQGFSLQKTADFCNCAGTLVTMKRGAIGMALPSLDEVLDMMKLYDLDEKSE